MLHMLYTRDKSREFMWEYYFPYLKKIDDAREQDVGIVVYIVAFRVQNLIGTQNEAYIFFCSLNVNWLYLDYQCKGNI